MNGSGESSRGLDSLLEVENLFSFVMTYELI